ncbi:DUF6209 family protein [Ferruginibacter sp.]
MGHIIFTADFHEIIRGKLSEEKESRIAYDPLRLVAGKPAAQQLSDPGFHFKANLVFEPSGATIAIPLVSETGRLENLVERIDGTGSMLSGTFVIPVGTEEISAWVEMTTSSGQMEFDSDFGKNFHFRIAENDLQVLSVEINNTNDQLSSVLNIQVNSVQAIEKMLVRYRIANSKEPYSEFVAELVPSVENEQKRWIGTGIQLPSDAVIMYELIYFVNGNRFKVENNGKYFIASAGDIVSLK